MLRPSSLLPALVAVATMLALQVVPAAPASAYAVSEQGEEAQLSGTLSGTLPGTVHDARSPKTTSDSPLAVSIATLSPSVVPRKGPIRVTGSVTNNDADIWRNVRTYAFMSGTPITSSAELAENAALPEDAYVGDRITQAGSYASIDELAPGETAQFSIKVPRKLLPADLPGVYWFGIHALGAGPEGRIDGADGRARTFVPLVEPTRKQQDTALVLPLRRDTSYAADGRLENVARWTAALAPDGKLRNLVDFGASAGSRPLTWLIDPSLPDAVRRLVAGNPPVSFASTPAEGVDQNGSPTPAPSAGDDPSTSSDSSRDTGSGTAEAGPLVTATAEAASSWLDRLHEGLRSSQILALPYGDIDVAAAAQRNPSLYSAARKRSGTELAPWGLRMTPAIAPPAGYLDADALDLAGDDTTTLVTDKMFPGVAPALARVDGTDLLATSSGAVEGGPGPDDPRGAVALRQRIISEAALRLQSPGRQPLVVLFPQHWSPTGTTGFFEGLDVDWLHLTSVADASAHKSRPIAADDLAYPGREVRRELDAANFAATDSLIQTGETVQSVLTDKTTVAGDVSDRAYSTVSYSARAHADDARAKADAARAWLQRRLARIGILAPPQVTLSSASGGFSATLVNGLDQPVTVSIQAKSDQPLEITVPETIPIAAGGRATVLLNATTERPGVHNVTLLVTDIDGTPLGSSDEFPIRSAQVSGAIWLILGTGVALLFGAIAIRLFRRLRAAARTASQA